MPPSQPTSARRIVAWIVVLVTVVAVWTFVDYRNRPPDLKTVTSDQ
jgi:hypothetical protein